MIQIFRHFMINFKEVEEKIGRVNDNSVSWFKKKRQVAEAIFNPILKVSKDKEMVSLMASGPPT